MFEYCPVITRPVSTEDEIVLKYPNIEVTIIMPPDTRTNILLIDCFVLYGLSALCSLLKTKSIFRLQNTFLEDNNVCDRSVTNQSIAWGKEVVSYL